MHVRIELPWMCFLIAVWCVAKQQRMPGCLQRDRCTAAVCTAGGCMCLAGLRSTRRVMWSLLVRFDRLSCNDDRCIAALHHPGSLAGLCHDMTSPVLDMPARLLLQDHLKPSQQYQHHTPLVACCAGRRCGCCRSTGSSSRYQTQRCSLWVVWP